MQRSIYCCACRLNLGLALLDGGNPGAKSSRTKEEAKACFLQALDFDKENEEARFQLLKLVGGSEPEHTVNDELVETIQQFHFDKVGTKNAMWAYLLCHLIQVKLHPIHPIHHIQPICTNKSAPSVTTPTPSTHPTTYHAHTFITMLAERATQSRRYPFSHTSIRNT